MKTRWMKLLVLGLFIFVMDASAKKQSSAEDSIDYISHQKMVLIQGEKVLESKKKLFEKELFLQMQTIQQERDNLESERMTIENLKSGMEIQRKELKTIEDRVKSVAQGKVVSIYSKMKPKDAAKIISKMLPKRKKEVLAIIMELEDRQARAIVSKLPSDLGAEITETLWNFSRDDRNSDNN